MPNPIITSLADTDLYKFTMAQVVLHQFADTQVEYEFRCRTEGVDLTPFADELEEQIQALSQISFTPEEIQFLGSLRYLKPGFLDFLRIFRMNPNAVEVVRTPEFGIRVRGNWAHTIWFEIPILAMVCEIYYRHTAPTPDLAEAEQRLLEKINLVREFQKKNGENKPFRLIEFGTRRRFSKSWQQRILQVLIREIPTALFGTSNVHLARTQGIRPIGTMAHEFLQAMQGMNVRLANSQKYALQCWADEYRGDLGIALTDVIGIEAFLHDFDLYFSKLFDGVRHDSGSPFEWTERILTHYRDLRIDPKEKAVVYSDSLNFSKALSLCEKYEGLIKTSFGIGTHLTCDIPEVRPLNIVMKMVRCNGQPVAKLSDSPGKTMCRDETFLQYLRSVFKEAPR